MSGAILPSMTHTEDARGSTRVQCFGLQRGDGELPLRATIATEVGLRAAVRGDGAASA